MRIVFDTNILVLSLMGDPAASIMQAAPKGFSEEPLDLYYSKATFAEYEQVLHRLTGKGPEVFSVESVTNLLRSFKQRGERAYPVFTLDACSHEPDNRFLECAVAANADCIVTVNGRHFPPRYRGIEVVPPRRFYRMLFGNH